MKIVYGDILAFQPTTNHYLAHQCNTTTIQVAGLASQVFKKHPNAHHKDKLRHAGTIDIIDNIINMYGQVLPGGPGVIESRALRLEYFTSCLAELYYECALFRPDSSIAFPYRIGCGIAQGDWGQYMDLLTRFDKAVTTQIYLCKYDG